MSVDMGRRIKDLLYSKNMSQGDLADKLGITRQSLSIWLTSKRMPKIENLEKIAEILDVTVPSLLSESEQVQINNNELNLKMNVLEEKIKRFESEFSLLKKEIEILKNQNKILETKLKAK